MYKFYIGLSELSVSIGAFSVINAASKVLPFLLLPILTKFLQPAEFGQAALFIATSSLLIPFVGLRGDALIYKIMGEKKEEVEKVFAILKIIPILNSVLISVIYFSVTLIYRDIDSVLGISKPWVFLAILTALMNCFLIFNNSIYQFERKLGQYARIQFLQAAATFGITLALIIGLIPGSAGRNLGYSFPILVLGMWSWLKLSNLSGEHFVFQIRQIYVIFGTAFPLMVGNVASLMAGAFDRYAVAWYLGNDSLGIYAFGVTLGLIYALFAEGVDLAWTPYVTKKVTNLQSRRGLFRTGWIIVLGLGIGGAIYASLIPLLVTYLGRSEAYYEATPVALATVVAVVCKVGFNIFSTIAIFTGHQRYSLKINLLLTLLMPIGIWVGVKFGGLVSPQYAVAAIYSACAVFYVLAVYKTDR